MEQAKWGSKEATLMFDEWVDREEVKKLKRKRKLKKEKEKRERQMTLKIGEGTNALPRKAL